MKRPLELKGDGFFLTGFACLGTERSFPGNGIGPIPWSKAWDYAHRHGHTRRWCNHFAEVILLLDGHYRDHLREEQEKQAKREEKLAKREARAKAGSAGGEGLGQQRHRAPRGR